LRGNGGEQMKENLKQVLATQRKTLIITFFLVFATLLFSYSSFQQHNINNMRLIMIKNEKISVKAQTSIIQEELNGIDNDLEFLYNAPTFRDYIDGKSRKCNVEKEWVVFLNSMKKYDKLRYINESGKEVIRINFNNGHAKKVEDNFLQNQGNQYYFTDAFVHSKGQIYISKFDLNIEGNTFELPVKPIIRAALPVFDKEGKDQGIIIINYLGEFVLHEIKDANTNSRYMQLVNEDGYWLTGPKEENNWAFLYPDRREQSFKNEFPEEWARIKTEGAGQFFSRNGIFTFQYIDFVNDILRNRGKREVATKNNKLSTTAGFIISQIPANVEPYANDYSSYLLSLSGVLRTPLLLLGLLLISLLFAVLFALYQEDVRKTKIALTYDKLTGCLKRVAGINKIEREIKRADRYNRHLSLIMMDVDYFKQVNDSYGHPIGDIVLKTIAGIAIELLRETDSIIRLGGEEFLILLPETNVLEARKVAEKIRSALENHAYSFAGKVTASFGVSERISNELFTNWYERLDAALYRAKNGGRNKVVVASDKEQLIFIAEQLKWRSEWESGHREIDAQHRSLLKVGNKLINMLFSGADNELILKKLDILIEDIIKHFEYEEKVLAGFDYWEYEEHANIHKELIAKADTLKEDYRSGEIKPAALVSFIIADVLSGHMLKEDVKFFPFLKGEE